jgi:hypothetical protein
MRRAAAVTALVLLSGPVAGPSLAAQELHLIPGIREVASDSIADLAVAAVDLVQPVIYYNPRMARRYGPTLTRFFIAHEYGHIALRHTRAGLVSLPDAARDSLLRVQELAADCYAASRTGDGARQATEAALRFFVRLGPFRFDAEHPTGAQRAAQILTCMPDPPEPDAYSRGETGVEVGPVSGEPQPVRFEVRTPTLAAAEFGNQAILWMDGQRVGELSNMRFPGSLSVDRFGAGIHGYQLTLDVYGFEGQLQLSPSGTVTGRGHVAIQDGDRFLVEWIPGEAPRLVKEPAADRPEP